MSGRVRGALWAVLVLELAVGAWAIRGRLSSPAVPAANLDRLPPSTAAEIRRLQQQARSTAVSAWLELGEAYLAYGYFPQAEVCLRHVVKQTPRSFPAVFAHAYSLDRLCRLPEAERQYRAAAALAQGTTAANCWYHIGVCRLRDNDAVQAEVEFRRAGNAYPPAVHALARQLIRSGRAAEALPLIDDLRNELSQDVQTEMLAVQAWRELGKSHELARAAEAAERSQPRLRLTDHWEYLHPIRTRYGLMAKFAAARAPMERGELRAAAEAYRHLLDSEPLEFTDTMFEQPVQICLMAGQHQHAAQILDRYRNRLSLSPSARHLWGDTLSAAGKIEDAIAQWQQANRLRPDEHSYQSLSAARERLGQSTLAKRDLALASLFRGIDAYRENELDKAAAELIQASRDLPDDARPVFYLGEIHLARSELDAARAAYRKCLERDPDHGRALERLDQFRP